MKDALVWLSAIAAVIGIVTFFGAAAFYLRGSKDKGTIQTLETNNHALFERVKILETSESALLIRVKALEDANHVLTETLTARADIAELAAVIDTHNNFVAEWTEKVDAFIAKVYEFIDSASRMLKTLIGRK